MAVSNMPTDVLPCIILAKLEVGEMVEIASVAKCLLTQNPTIAKPIIMTKLLMPSIVC